MRALVVEDDPEIRSELAQSMEQAGFLVDMASEGEDAWFKGDVEEYAVAVLDLGLPNLDGLTVLRRWRANRRNFPVLIVSAKGDWTEKVEGFEAGADDYLAKPFAMGECIARIRSLVRRAAGHATTCVRAGKLTLDTSRMTATFGDNTIRLTPLEFRLLDYLAHQPGRVISAVNIAENLYGIGDENEVNALEALVARLRRKVGVDAIQTRRGFGYLLPE